MKSGVYFSQPDTHTETRDAQAERNKEACEMSIVRATRLSFQLALLSFAWLSQTCEELFEQFGALDGSELFVSHECIFSIFPEN